jgi:sugar phosphate isomerase/epimerase
MVVKDLRKGGSEVAPVLVELGYDYIELSLAHLTELSGEDFYSVKRMLAVAGIPCESCNNFFPPHLKLTGTEVNLPSILLYATKAVERAAELGSSIVVFGSGQAKNVPDGFPKELAWQQLVSLCQALDPVAGANHITIVLEPLRKAECNIVNSVAEGLELIKVSNTKNIKLLVDFYHLDAENESPDILLEAASNISHVHLANPAGRGFPKSWNENHSYQLFFEKLKRINYNGRVSVEAFTDDFYEDAKASINFMNQIKQAWI